jgi:hypothetical protein
MISEVDYKQALNTVVEYRKQAKLPVIIETEAKFNCDCGCYNFTYIEPEEALQLKEKIVGTKHNYKCDNCGKTWWSYFYRMDTENFKNKKTI